MPGRQPWLTSEGKNQRIRKSAITKLLARKYCGADKTIVSTCVAGAPIPRTGRANKKNERQSRPQPEGPMSCLWQMWRRPWAAFARSATCERQSRKLRGSNLRQSCVAATYKYDCLIAGAVDGFR